MKVLALVTVAIVAAHATAACASQNTTGQPATAQLPAARTAPQPARDILVAQPFTVEQEYRNWTRERATVRSGVVVVLEVDPKLASRRDAAEPILYAGDTPVQRLNNPVKSGRVIGIVPGVTDLTGIPIFFGAPGLPERVTKESAQAERAIAESTGIAAFAADKVRSVTRPPVTAPDIAALLRDHVAPLVLQYSPEERDLAESWRLPVATAPPKQPAR